MNKFTKKQLAISNEIIQIVLSDYEEVILFSRFAEIEGFSTQPGEKNYLLYSDHENSILWTGLTSDALKVLQSLQKIEIVETVYVSPAVYLIEKYYIKFPIGKPGQTYKKPHWIPCGLTLAAKVRELNYG